MSRSTISTFKLFEMFPDEETARQYLESRLSLPNHNSSFVWDAGGIRRYAPSECERLMGFPVGYTDIPKASRNARHAALGNSMVIPVMRWIGKRIQTIETRNVDS